MSETNVVDIGGTKVAVSELQAPATLQPATFPWPEIRDFISILISEKMAEQSCMVGAKMLEQGAPGVTEEQLAKVQEQHRMLSNTSQALNKMIEGRLAELDGKPKILLPSR